MRRGAVPWAALAASLGLLLAWDASGADMAIARALGDPAGFSWRDAWAARVLLHDGGRWLAALALLLLGFDAWRPWVAGPSRADRAAALGVVLLCLTAVPAIKQISLSSCPWDLAQFGGSAAYVSHWRWGVADGGPGRCFPSGHAVAAWAFVGLYPPWRAARPTLAAVMLAASVGFGLLFGAAQVLRGAHFVSHALWSAWACVALTLGAQAVLRWARESWRLKQSLRLRLHPPQAITTRGETGCSKRAVQAKAAFAVHVFSQSHQAADEALVRHLGPGKLMRRRRPRACQVPVHMPGRPESAVPRRG